MYKAREQGLDAKVVGRFLHIREKKYNAKNVPEELNKRVQSFRNRALLGTNSG